MTLLPSAGSFSRFQNEAQNVQAGMLSFLLHTQVVVVEVGFQDEQQRLTVEVEESKDTQEA
jgi:hypothetical protein